MASIVRQDSASCWLIKKIFLRLARVCQFLPKRNSYQSLESAYRPPIPTWPTEETETIGENRPLLTSYNEDVFASRLQAGDDEAHDHPNQAAIVSRLPSHRAYCCDGGYTLTRTLAKKRKSRKSQRGGDGVSNSGTLVSQSVSRTLGRQLTLNRSGIELFDDEIDYLSPEEQRESLRSMVAKLSVKRKFIRSHDKVFYVYLLKISEILSYTMSRYRGYGESSRYGQDNQWREDLAPDYDDQPSRTNNRQYSNIDNSRSVTRGPQFPQPLDNNENNYLNMYTNYPEQFSQYRSGKQPIRENNVDSRRVNNLRERDEYGPQQPSSGVNDRREHHSPRRQDYPEDDPPQDYLEPHVLNYEESFPNYNGSINAAYLPDIDSSGNNIQDYSHDGGNNLRYRKSGGLYQKHLQGRRRNMSERVEEDRVSKERLRDVLATIRIKGKKVYRGDEDEQDREEEEEQHGLPSLARIKPKSLHEKLQAKDATTTDLAEGLRDLDEEDGFKSVKHKFKQSWQRQKADIKGYFYQFELWASTFKEIEGKFGTATASYFRFTRWLMFLNIYIFLITVPVIVLPTFFSSNQNFVGSYNVTNGDDNGTSVFFGIEEAVNCSHAYNDHIRNFEKDTLEKVLNFFKGAGWMEKTHLFYGLYFNLTFTTDENEVQHFNIGLAYLLAIGITFLISFILILKNSGKSVKEGVIDQEESNTLYCNKVFSAWDFCIFNEKAAKVKHANISYEFKADLEEQRLRLRRADRSARERYRLYAVRFFINIFVIVVLGACLYLIYWTTEKLLELNKKEDLGEFLNLVIEFLPSLTITLLNVIIPLIFSYIVTPEDYSPVFELKITLFRTVLLRLASLGVLVFSLYFQLVSVENAKCIPETGVCCGNYQWTNTNDKGSIKCWETYIGQQFYKLALLDFAVVLIVTFVYEFPRTLIYSKYNHKKLLQQIGEQEFDLPKNVLDIVYSQTLCWLGMFFCPLIPLITMLKCFIIFYVKKLSLIKNCVPTKRPYKASRSNSFFMTVLLISFILSAVPLGYMLGNIPPSQSCGPFRVYSAPDYVMFNSITDEIGTWPNAANQVFSFMGTVGFFVPAMILLCLVMYYYWAAAQGYKKKQELLKEQLKLDGRDRQYLLARVNEVIKKGDLMSDTTITS
ncbi:hypothetical protein LOTGIDRAFT_228950 [Lottia gigantea]|uniref:TMC domain-containing protein n=1 Tax=Lottia gigantea TaxID=225164 RepID=V3ZD29_LOTGI|nr:hypothetical protein LOTGIDRAFT_228950 [Lottia gigantea]ESO89008.1 hypothetical protein LOTGIDRAFT_228950 [Lottia gigantea]